MRYTLFLLFGLSACLPTGLENRNNPLDPQAPSYEAACGNGLLDEGEVCDDGNTVSSDACMNCQMAFCGDGVRRLGLARDDAAYEECDDGNTIQTDNCSDDCKLAACGNGRIDPGEDCDDRNLNDRDGCSSQCTLAFCGDGIVRNDLPDDHPEHELCDDGNADDTDNCSSNCQPARCGDGILRQDKVEGEIGYEACDDGNENETDACRSSCRLASCGDGVRREDLSPNDEGYEACDDGNPIEVDDCTPSCQIARCGDGYLRLTDPPEGELPEQCDDGNEDDNDGCLNTCQLAQCGDGIVRQDLDPGSLNACDPAAPNCPEGEMCLVNRCHRIGYESCDDQNDANDDACLTGCIAARCGDGVLRTDRNENQADYEACDDGNDNDADACVDCQTTGCGDGVRQALTGEECDDGNDIDHDLCDNDCLLTRTVVIGGLHTCALHVEDGTFDGRVDCWGDNRWGQMGQGNVDMNASQSRPNTVPDLEGVMALSAAQGTTCALTADGSVVCWGLGANGQIGAGEAASEVCNGDSRCTSSPTAVVDLGGASLDLSSGTFHSCVIDPNRRSRCWGYGGFYQLGDGIANVNQPRPRLGPALSKRQITAGMYHSCALSTEGEVSCWGRGNTGQLGAGTTADSSQNPVLVQWADRTPVNEIIALHSGMNHNCVIRDPAVGELWCWGDNEKNQLAAGGDQIDLEDDIGAYCGNNACAEGSVCVVHDDNQRFCYRRCAADSDCPLGQACSEDQICQMARCGQDANTPCMALPSPVRDSQLEPLVGAQALGGGQHHTCMLTANRQMTCWGDNQFGQLGNLGPNGTRGAWFQHPLMSIDRGKTIEGATDVREIASGASIGHQCYRDVARNVFCLGDNSGYQLGDGSAERRLLPVRAQ